MNIEYISYLFEKEYGKRGYWPLVRLRSVQSNDVLLYNGFHTNDYSYPKTRSDIYETIIGIIISQNTKHDITFRVVNNLFVHNLLDANKINSISNQDLLGLIKECANPNQKVKAIKEFSKLFVSCEDFKGKLSTLYSMNLETYNTILLFVYKERVFPINSNARRFFERFDDSISNLSDNEISKIVLDSNLDVYQIQELFAQVNEHSRIFCKAVPDCRNCPLLSSNCAYYYKKFS